MVLSREVFLGYSIFLANHFELLVNWSVTQNIHFIVNNSLLLSNVLQGLLRSISGDFKVIPLFFFL